jgi:broad specificity phosphatase PhoE
MSSLIILIIRHGEKPDDPKAPWPGPGFTEKGLSDNKSLVVRGWERAGAWAALFGSALGGDEYPRPAVIYAADPNSRNGKQPSRRPFETISPLAARLNLTPVTKHALGGEAALVEEIIGLTGVALISWEHKHIVEAILPAIANGQTLHELPTTWDGSRFDVVLRFDRAIPGAPWSFRQSFPRLLCGDSDVPLN